MKPRLLQTVATVAIMLLATNPAFAQGQRMYLTKDIYKQNGKIHFSAEPGHARLTADEKHAKELPLGDWKVSGTGYYEFGDHIALTKRNPRDGSQTFRVFGPDGSPKGELTLPANKAPTLNAKSVYVSERSLHGPMTSHEIWFYSLEGELIRRVSDPALGMVAEQPEPSGHLVTLNLADEEMLVRVYDKDGARLWDYAVPEGIHPQLDLSPDGQKLLVADQGLRGETIVVSQAGRVATRLPVQWSVRESAFSEDSGRLAFVDAYGLRVFYFDAMEVKFSMRGPLRMMHNGMVFDESGRYLYLMVAIEEGQGQVGRELREIDLDRGKIRTIALPNVSQADPGDQMFGMEAQGHGKLKIRLLNRIEDVESDEWK